MTEVSNSPLERLSGEVSFAAASGEHERLIQMIFGASIVQIVRCAAIFSLADHLAAGPATSEAIAKTEGLDEAATLRFLRACASFGLLALMPDGRFAATPLLEPLRKDDPRSLRELALMQAGPGHWAPWGLLDRAIRTGKSQDEAALGLKLFDYYASPDGQFEGEALVKAMSGSTFMIDAAAGQTIQTADVKTVVDVGGAGGSLLRSVLKANPALAGILFDLPNVIETAGKIEENHALGKRLQRVAGSFFEIVPTGDLYLLRYILHDWSDVDAIRILRAVRKSAQKGARLSIIEVALDDGVPAPFASQIDLTMLMALGGRERSLKEFQGLLDESGFRFASCNMLSSPFSLIEAVAV